MSTAAPTAPPLAQVVPRRSAALSRVSVGLLLAVVLLTLALAWYWRWTSDDAFINFRVVRNILDGHGPVFNAGQRVEAGTSPLWVWLLAAAAAVLPWDVSWISVVLGGLLSAAAVVLACLGAAEINRSAERRRTLLPIGALIFLAVPATWSFLTSGLETGLTFAWLGTLWFGTARVASRATSSRPWWLLVAVGLGPLVRPDLAVVAGVIGLWLFIAVRSTWLVRVRDVAIAVAIPGAYEVFRMGWYGLLVPNTAVAKEFGRPLWGRGFGYLLDLVAPYNLYIPTLLVAVLLVLTGWSVPWDRRRLGLVVATVAAGLIQIVFVVRVGGDFMHGRLLLLALFQLLCPVAMCPLPRRPAWAQWGSAALVTGITAWALICALFLRVDYQDRIGPRGIADERGFYAADSGIGNPVTVADQGHGRPVDWGRQVARSAASSGHEVFAQDSFANVAKIPVLVPLGTASDGTYFLVYQAGYLSYASPDEVRVLDFFGLADPLGSHMEAGPPGRPGHEKLMPITWFWAAHGAGMPDLQSPEPQLGQVTATGLDAARATLRCGDVADLVAATGAQMSPHRFWSNLAGSVHRTFFRIPTDPVQARKQFC